MKTNTTNIPAGYKNSPLGIIPIDWEVKRLGEIATFHRTNTLSRDQLNYNSGKVKNIHYGDILVKFDSILDVNKENIPFVNDTVTSKFGDFVENGDIIFADTAEDETVGKACEVIGLKDEKLVSGLHTMLLRPNKSLFEPKYMGFYINSSTYHNTLLPYIQGAKVSSLSKEVIAKSYVPVPPLATQRRIAEILTTWDEAIEKQSQKIKQLEQRKKGLMQQLLTGKKRLNGFTDKWKTVKLGEVFMERNETNRGDLPLLSIGQNGVYPQSESAKKDTSNEDKSKYKRICPNDIGYNTMRMWQGRSALSALEGIVSPAYTIVTPNSEQNPIFISELIKLPQIVNDFWRHSQGLVSDTLNCKFPDFSQVKVTIPSYKEQTAIAAILTTADEEIQNEKQKLENLKSQKKGLMQVLLTGKVRVKG